ncbi:MULTISPECIES: Hint domain-containing protein [unclassified Yoonia]|uniref:Hint domain-containing protein n=1 Tax=unclassified Yoonia TaxID=2629118 RepID=UPI002AFE01A1|nr:MULTISPECIES: Hint domain-containing protein [unclassified Yoonia]
MDRDNVVILLTGDQIATLSREPTNQNNSSDADFGMKLDGVTALSDENTVYRLVWWANNNNVDQYFVNGQRWRLEAFTGSGDPASSPDQSNWTVVPGRDEMSPRPDLVGGLGGGDEYIVFATNAGHMIYNINGGFTKTPSNQVYLQADENGDPESGTENRELNFSDSINAFTPICFCAGTLIATDEGPVPIENLKIGDLVVTRDHGLQPIRWIGRSEMSLAQTTIFPKILPVHVAAGAMGPGLPRRDLWLSPQHRVMVRSKIVARMTNQPEALVAVRQLCATPGITQMTKPQAVTYLHLRLDQHDMVCAEGLWAETLLLGPQALRSMGPAARQELALIFPGVTEDLQQAARPVISGQNGRNMAQRHVKNDKHLLDLP